MPNKIILTQNKVLKYLSNKINDFYLGGGTALSLFYFRHRESIDLDFFSKELSRNRVVEIIGALSDLFEMTIEFIAEETRKNRAKIFVFSLPIDKNDFLKIDFIQDYLPLIKAPNQINGINILSMEDIYLRKLCAITGTLQVKDNLGRKNFKGGRQEAKDLYDLYCLSQVFMRLSEFSFKFTNRLMREAIIRWFRTYKRLDMKTGLLELKLKKDIDYIVIERHFKKEIDKIIEKEIG